MLKFVNNYPEDVWVAYMFLSTDTCGAVDDPESGGGFQAIGWFHMAPGESAVVYGNDLQDVANRYWLYFAATAGLATVWAGQYPVQVPLNGPFNHCYNLGQTDWTQVGFRLFDVGDGTDDFTMTLVA
jgi:hypothetical protein